MKPPNDQPIRIPDVPLPGNYECLTLQLNVTLYPSPDTAKYVCIVRDPAPDRQIELSRLGGIVPLPTVMLALQKAIAESVNGMLYLANRTQQ